MQDVLKSDSVTVNEKSNTFNSRIKPKQSDYFEDLHIFEIF